MGVAGYEVDDRVRELTERPVPIDALCTDSSSRSVRVVVSGPQVVVEENRSRVGPDRDHKSSQSERRRAGHGPPPPRRRQQSTKCANLAISSGAPPAILVRHIGKFDTQCHLLRALIATHFPG